MVSKSWQEETADMAADFITTMSYKSASSQATLSPAYSVSIPPLTDFIVYSLYRTRYDKEIVLSALYLLKRLHERHPTKRGMSGHRLFLTAFMLSSKLLSDQTYSTKSWCEVGQKLFSVFELNQMEREMMECLDWEIHVPPDELVKLMDNTKGGPPWARTAVLDTVVSTEGPSKFGVLDESDQSFPKSSPSSSGNFSSYYGSDRWSTLDSPSSPFTSDDEVQFVDENKIAAPAAFDQSFTATYAYARPSVW